MGFLVGLDSLEIVGLKVFLDHLVWMALMA